MSNTKRTRNLIVLASLLTLITQQTQAQAPVVEPDSNVNRLWKQELHDQKRELSTPDSSKFPPLTPSVYSGPIDNAGKVREIIFNAGDDQNFMTSKVYHLKHIHACDIVPYVNGALTCFGTGKAERLNYGPQKEQYLSVTTSRKMIPYIDRMIDTLDRNGKRADFTDKLSGYSPLKEKRMTIVDGTGMFKQVYWPEYRHHNAMSDAVRSVGTVSSDGKIYHNANHGFFTIKDSISDGRRTLEFLRYLDRTLPQMELIIRIYEVSDQNEIELGIDWLSWKNGPAYQMPLFGVGGSGLQGASSGIESLIETSSWMYGGIFFAPQFDASFLRLLANKGKIRTQTAARLVVTNGKSAEITFHPAFQNIQKTEKDITGIYADKSQGYTLQIQNPTLCFEDQTKNLSATENIMFNYKLNTQSVAGRNHRGETAINKMSSESALTLQNGNEKPLAVFSKTQDIEQTIGWPVLSDIPVLKYIFGNTKHVSVNYRYYVTVQARAISEKTSQDPWVDNVKKEAQIAKKN